MIARTGPMSTRLRRVPLRWHRAGRGHRLVTRARL